eukprot:1157785-Pelagomonas_calceolata.AAC.7
MFSVSAFNTSQQAGDWHISQWSVGREIKAVQALGPDSFRPVQAPRIYQVLAAQLKALRSVGSEFDWVGYLSSTGVYGDYGGNWVDERCANAAMDMHAVGCSRHSMPESAFCNATYFARCGFTQITCDHEWPAVMELLSNSQCSFWP